MCDLIDLKSPDRKGLQNSRLASPLIPVPTDAVNGNCSNRVNNSIPLITGKRDSLENNPFDMVLHKTTEYIQKRDDPFELTLEKALKPQHKRNSELRTCSLDFTDDYSLKQKDHMQKLKMNKTLDECSSNEGLCQSNININKMLNENVIFDLNNINMLHNKTNNVIPIIDVQDIDLSILNQSVMNDTLFETNKETNENEMTSFLHNKMLMQADKSKVNTEQNIPPNLVLKIPRVHRSLSQGESVSSKSSQLFKYMSLLEPSRIGSESRSTVSSLNSLDLLNEGFIKSHYSESSMFSSLSNISSITKLNSVSSTTNSSILLSNDTINRAFLESCSSDKSENLKLNENTAMNNERTSVTNVPTECTILNLRNQFHELKATVSELPYNFEEQHNAEYYVNNKLIDVDIFTPEINSSKEQYKSSVSDTSSDSVFLEGNKVDKSIFHEAKLLAKTFEELALKTSSGSSTDDLISNNPLWTSELLPAFDDEEDNLIELPTSPNANDSESKTNDEPCVEENSEDTTNKVIENTKQLELELIEPICTEKRITAATLLLDLKKLIKSENNVEADKLVENLEKVLGINCESNIELLTTCLNATNNLAKSPQKSDNSLKLIQNISKTDMEQSQDDNLTNDSKSIKESDVINNMDYNDSNLNKSTGEQKHFKKINTESSVVNTGRTDTERNEKDVNVESVCKKDFYKEGSNNSLNEKIVLELLTNIGKLLIGQTENHSTVDTLTNLGKVLNFASNNDIKPDGTNRIQPTPKKSKLKFEDKVHSSIPSKSVNRLSLNLESEKQTVGKNLIRRSISISQTSSKDETSLMSSNKNTCQLKEVTKRFPSDPGFITSPSNNKPITKSNKNGLNKNAQIRTFTALDLKKEKIPMISKVKNKLKKKIETDVINKKGPMKAVLPIGTMQKKEVASNKIVPSYGIITPPKSDKIISSTPNSTDIEYAVKRTQTSKPVASSTPDAQNSKSRKIQSQVTKKRNFSCDISPVTTCVNVNNNNKINSSPRRKLPSPKKTTPKRRSIGSAIPRSQTPPHKKLNSSFDVNQSDKLNESPQRSLCKTSNSQKNSPISLKKNGNIQRSPLRESNKLVYKAKPMKLISKLQRHSIDSNLAEKENYI